MRFVQTLIVILVFATLTVNSQDKLKTTTSFTISGEVKAPLTVNLTDMKKWKERPIDDIVITNHLGEKKSESKGLKGVLLRDVLSGVEINSESPKVLSEYYFVCKATDGYAVVYSWNEIFNTAVGDTAFIVTEKNGKKMDTMDDSILMVSSKDFKTGRRHVKSLTSIEVKRAK
jgi:hypothetical protein